LSPGVLDRVVSTLKINPDPQLLVGFETADDAGVYKISDDTALIQTLDFFTPIVDSPFAFGSIAAANALSDVYAMGGRPLTAMNIVCFPSEDLPESVLMETLAGGLEKIHESGTTLVGGHSVEDAEFKYGLSVTGLIHPDRILTNAKTRINDRLILTKPIGTGILATAVKGKLAKKNTIQNLVTVASTLNKYAAEIILKFNPNALTDITGFGLAGHVYEMAAAAKMAITLYAENVPLIEDVLDFARMGMFPAGAYNNKHFFKTGVFIEPGVDAIIADLMFDPQTSGGLVASMGETNAKDCLKALRDQGIDARIIGEVTGAVSGEAFRTDACGRVLII
jgi:selenide,water dikinase